MPRSITRRNLLRTAAALGAGVATRSWPQGKVHRIAGLGWHPKWEFLPPFFSRLAELGFAQGRNIEMGWYFPRGFPLVDQGEIRARVRGAIEWKPDVIATIGAINVRLIREATSTIPVVFGLVDDPIADGFVSSLGRPGGNVTGAALAGDMLAGKRLELARELVPRARRIGVIFVSTVNDQSRALTLLRAAAARLGVTLVEIDLSEAAGGVDQGLRRLAAARAEAIVPLGFFDSTDRDLLKKVRAHQEREHAPIVDWDPDIVVNGAVAGLGESAADHLARMAEVMAVVLEGRTPVSLIPVSASMRVRFNVSLSAAARTGIELPPSILVRADSVLP